MRAEERRRSDRVSLLSAIRVTGADPTGEAFSEEARTVLVTLHGAAILVKRRLLPEHQLTIRSYGTGNEAKVRVVGQIEQQPEGGLYGVKFLHPDVNPWDIRFPPLAASEDALVRLLLQCAACRPANWSTSTNLKRKFLGQIRASPGIVRRAEEPRFGRKPRTN